jgi:hypothetical protein
MSLKEEILPEGIQRQINQYILHNTNSYNAAKHPEAIDSLNIFTPHLTKTSDSVFAIDHMKFHGLEKFFDVKKIGNAISSSKTQLIQNKLL